MRQLQGELPQLSAKAIVREKKIGRERWKFVVSPAVFFVDPGFLNQDSLRRGGRGDEGETPG